MTELSREVLQKWEVRKSKQQKEDFRAWLELPENMALVREALTAELLTAKQEEHYADVLAQWISEADVKSYPEKMGY